MFGLLNINKPAGWTSRDVVNRVGRLAGKNVKVGHAGTLDPLATGVLVVCVGPATRLVPWIHDHLKTYDATFQLGFRSNTDDTDGQVEPVSAVEQPSLTAIRQALPEFVGTLQQVPPAYSALKVNGRRAYSLARAGEAVELAAREVFVSKIDLVDYAFPELRLTIECGTGTYIRSIGRDLARRVGTEAVMSSLVRTRVGAFSVEEAVSLETLTPDSLAEALQNPLSMLSHLPRITVSPAEAQRLVWGQSLPAPEGMELKEGACVAVANEADILLAIVQKTADRLAPQNVFVMKE